MCLVRAASIASFALIALVAASSCAGLTGQGRAAAEPARAKVEIDHPPGVYREITRDPATTETLCLGQPPRTPICAVEHVLACQFRGDPDLCRIAAGEDGTPRRKLSIFDHHYSVAYRITGVTYGFERRAPARNLRLGEWTDSDLILHVERTSCGEPGHCEWDARDDLVFFLLRPKDDGTWLVVGWDQGW